MLADQVLVSRVLVSLRCLSRVRLAVLAQRAVRVQLADRAWARGVGVVLGDVLRARAALTPWVVPMTS